MRPYFVVNARYKGVIRWVHDSGRDIIVAITPGGATLVQWPTLRMTKSELRSFGKALEKAQSFFMKRGKDRLGGGGRVPYEYNDGFHRWYSGKQAVRDNKAELLLDDRYYYVEATSCSQPTARRMQKMVGEALRFNLKHFLEQLWRSNWDRANNHRTGQ